MTRHGSLDLHRTADAGVYYVNRQDFDALGLVAAQSKLTLCRIDLTGCTDKHELLRRMAEALRLTDDFGDNWDALLDSLRQRIATPGDGDALLFAHAHTLRRAAANDFETLVGILSDAAAFALEQSQPFFAFMDLPDSVIRPAARR